ncbi:MAG: cytochrome-c peroxidase [Planctomycetota bacterium]|nr:cytochrome-c peroxidase [Planctomycetota bacterium]
MGLVLSIVVFSTLSSKISRSDQRFERAEQKVQEKEAELAADRAITLQVPLGLKSVPIPSNNPLTEAKVKLGKQLFFDKRLSIDDSISCAGCHNPGLGWTDGKTVAVGIGGRTGDRNSPSLINTAHQRMFFWDGRAEDFEEQSLGPLLNPIEMGNPSKEFLVKKVGGIPEYNGRF